MEVKVNKQTYRVQFSHVKAFESKKSSKLVPFGTRCVISQVHAKGLTTAASSQTRAVHGDQFNRQTGRRVALQKALNVIWPESKVTYDFKSGRTAAISPAKNREARTAFWLTYFETVEGTKEEE